MLEQRERRTGLRRAGLFLGIIEMGVNDVF